LVTSIPGLPGSMVPTKPSSMLVTGSEWMPTHTSKTLKLTVLKMDLLSSTMPLVLPKLLLEANQFGSLRPDGQSQVPPRILLSQTLKMLRPIGIKLDVPTLERSILGGSPLRIPTTMLAQTQASVLLLRVVPPLSSISPATMLANHQAVPQQ
jgi:hypothetical protein